MGKSSSHIKNHNFNSPISEFFIRNCDIFPENKALFTDNRYYSYTELRKIVDAIYRCLPTDKIYNTIGIVCNDDVYTYASILAINLYGAAYVPINTKLPVAKNKRFIQLCNIDIILSSKETNKNDHLFKGINVIDVSNVKAQSAIHTSYRKSYNDIVYVLFTSGTTGEPKGAPITNNNLNHFFSYFINHFQISSDDRFLQASELTFDFSVFAFFMPLLLGACCYVVPDNEIKYLKVLDLLAKHEITVFSFVPTILKFSEKYLHEIKLPKLRYSFFSGDVLYYDIANKWSDVAPNSEIYNCYGTTETTIVNTKYLFDKVESKNESVNGIVPLGKPFSTLDVIIVDENNNICDKGEMCFSGEQVVGGYLGEDSDKFFTYNNRRYYKPGDIGYFNSQGNLIFLGRKDAQIKINGYRIELGEIEHVIEVVTQNKCVVVCKKDEKQMNYLVAYIEAEAINEKELITKLSAKLPNYMIPKKYLKVNRFDLTINGKIDKSKL